MNPVTATTMSWAENLVTPDMAVNPSLPILRALQQVATAAVPTMFLADQDVLHDPRDPSCNFLEPEHHVGRVIIALVHALVDAITVYDDCATAWRHDQATNDAAASNRVLGSGAVHDRPDIALLAPLDELLDTIVVALEAAHPDLAPEHEAHHDALGAASRDLVRTVIITANSLRELLHAYQCLHPDRCRPIRQVRAAGHDLRPGEDDIPF